MFSTQDTYVTQDICEVPTTYIQYPKNMFSTNVSLGIEPGYIVFPTQKIIVYSFIWRTAMVWKIREISSSVPNLSVMTARKCRVDRPFPDHMIR